MIGNLLQPELVELIRQRNFNQLREILCDFPGPDIAEILGDLSADDKAVLLLALPLSLVVIELVSFLFAEVIEELLPNLHAIVQTASNPNTTSARNEVLGFISALPKLSVSGCGLIGRISVSCQQLAQCL